MRYFYVPPREGVEGKPVEPLKYEFAGSTRVFHNPHCYFKEVDEPYDIGLIEVRPGVPKIGADGKPVIMRGKRKKWVIDEPKQAAFEAGDIPGPANHRDITAGELRQLRKAMYSDKAPFLKSQDQMKEEHDREMELMRRAHLDEIARLRKELEDARIMERARVDAEKRKMKKGE